MTEHNIYRITNQHGTVIWEGMAYSFFNAWSIMFDVTVTPHGPERSISTRIDHGMWVERLPDV